MTEINEAGYETHRRIVNSGLTPPAQWDYIELRDDQDAAVTRIEISDDERAEWTSTVTDQTQTVEVTVSGSDADISTPVTLAESALYNVDTGGDELHSDSMPDALIENDDDEVIVVHSIEVPEVLE